MYLRCVLLIQYDVAKTVEYSAVVYVAIKKITVWFSSWDVVDDDAAAVATKIDLHDLGWLVG